MVQKLIYLKYLQYGRNKCKKNHLNVPPMHFKNAHCILYRAEGKIKHIYLCNKTNIYLFYKTNLYFKHEKIVKINPYH